MEELMKEGGKGGRVEGKRTEGRKEGGKGGG